MVTTINRRHLLQGAGLGLAALALGGKQKALADPYGKPVGLQLYTVRDHIEKDLPGTIKKVAEIGYKEVELGGFEYYGQKPADLRRLLDDHGLKAISGHCTEHQLKTSLAKSIADAKSCGLTYIGLASLEEKDRKTLDGIKGAAEWFNQVGEAVNAAGCHFFYHGHNFDYAAVEGAVVYDELIRRTQPAKVNFELDCFWCVRAGKDPVDYFHRFPGRFPQLHIKDMKPGFPPTTGEDAHPPFTEVGRGIINWKKIFKAAAEGGLKHYYVEQDTCDGDSIESARISFEYLHHLTV